MLIAGTDEVGLGALAGPIMAVTVMLDAEDLSFDDLTRWWPLKGVNDSKELSERARENIRDDLARYIVYAGGEVGIGRASVHVIDEIGYAEAHAHAMNTSVYQATKERKPDLLIVDGTKYVRPYRGKQIAEPKADGRYFAVAAASILAKLYRDDLMKELAPNFPQYGWEKNKGYATAEHQAALLEHGMTEHHRALPCETVFRKAGR